MKIMQLIIVLLLNLVLYNPAFANDEGKPNDAGTQHDNWWNQEFANVFQPIQLDSIKELDGFVTKQGSVEINNQWQKIYIPS